jgi:hypothetical protein
MAAGRTSTRLALARLTSTSTDLARQVLARRVRLEKLLSNATESIANHHLDASRKLLDECNGLVAGDPALHVVNRRLSWLRCALAFKQGGVDEAAVHFLFAAAPVDAPLSPVMLANAVPLLAAGAYYTTARTAGTRAAQQLQRRSRDTGEDVTEAVAQILYWEAVAVNAMPSPSLPDAADCAERAEHMLRNYADGAAIQSRLASTSSDPDVTMMEHLSMSGDDSAFTGCGSGGSSQAVAIFSEGFSQNPVARVAAQLTKVLILRSSLGATKTVRGASLNDELMGLSTSPELPEFLQRKCAVAACYGSVVDRRADPATGQNEPRGGMLAFLAARVECELAKSYCHDVSRL